jgi:hypothetical protein
MLTKIYFDKITLIEYAKVNITHFFSMRKMEHGGGHSFPRLYYYF